MSFLTPLSLLLGLLALPILVLYMLRLRRREVLVSSTLLWQKLLRDREANAPWQRLRRNLLLLLQLLILAALVLALARPFIPVPSVVSGSVVVLLDGSASMQATDVRPNRFAAARTEVSRWIDDLGGGDRMTLILVGQTPQVLASASNERQGLRQALDQAEPVAGEVDWPAAFALASGAAQGFHEARVVIVSDGGLPPGLPPLPAETIYRAIGERGENLALTALATRAEVVDSEDASAARVQLFVGVQNRGLEDQDALLSIQRNGVLFDSRRIEVPAGEQRAINWSLPADTAAVAAALTEQSEDYLALDNQAWAVHEGGVSKRALLVTPGNIFLEQAFAVLPGIEVFKSAPGGDLLDEDGEPFDLYIFDSVPLPAELPAADLLLVNPLPPEGQTTPALEVGAVFSDTTVTQVADSPLLQFVDWSGVNISGAREVSSGWARPLVSAAGGPLLLVGEHDGFRAAILTFDLHDSDLPLQIAFPVLMANITNWLTPGQAFDAPTGIQPGDPVRITPGASTTAVIVEKPDGTIWSEDAEGDVVFSETGELGLYQLTLRDPNGDRPAGRFAVNLFSPAESEIQPVGALRLGQTVLETRAEEDVGQRELWPWLLAAAFIILIVEWWIHFRGARLPRLARREM